MSLIRPPSAMVWTSSIFADDFEVHIRLSTPITTRATKALGVDTE